MTPEERSLRFNKEIFTCLHCGVYVGHTWEHNDWGVSTSHCEIEGCQKQTVWVGVYVGGNLRRVMVYPDRGIAPQPHADLPAGPLADYEEAASLSGRSPRAAAALLRVCIERLVDELEPEDEDLKEKFRKEDLNGKIGKLVANGLPVKAQQALDTVRCIGNNNVHPGLMDPNENRETVAQLFALVNIIVDSMITQPKAIADLFDTQLTGGQKDQITRRDADSDAPGEQ